MKKPATRASGRRGARRGGARADILAAATREFSEHGPAGARTAAIARRAGVNIALVFYYFKSKSLLYRAILEEVFAAWSARVTPALNSRSEPQQAILDYVTAHFEFMAEAPLRANLIHAELSRRDRRLLAYIQQLAKRHVLPVYAQLAAMIRQGVTRGAFRKTDAEQTALSINALVPAYFSAAPVIHALRGIDPLSRGQLKLRRLAILDFIRSALFVPGKKPAGARKNTS